LYLPSFNLIENPFAILGVSPRDDRSKIIESYEKALTEEGANEDLLLKSQQALMVSKSRLGAEVSWFIGISPSRVRKIIDFLSKTLKEKEPKDLFSNLDGLDLANLLSHLCSNAFTSTKTMMALIEAQDRYSVEQVNDAVNANRTVSGFPKVDSFLVEKAIDSLREKHRSALFESVISSGHSGKFMTELVETFIDKDGIKRDFLEEVAERYDSWSTPILRKIRDEIDAATAHLRSNPKDQPAKSKIIKNLKIWDEYNQPLQLIYQDKDLDEPKSREIYKSLRGLCLWLANEKGEFSLSLEISKAILNTFPELPSVIDQVGDDIEALEDLAEEAKMDSALNGLTEIVGHAEKKMYPFLDSVLVGDFSEGKKGFAGKLYREFDIAVRGVKNTDHEGLPWSMVMSLAIVLNNDYQRSDAALIILGVLKSYKGLRPPPEERSKLEKNINIIKGNFIWEKFYADIRQGELKNALRLLDDLNSITKDEESRNKILIAKRDIQKKLNRRRIKYLVWGGIAIAVIIWIGSQDSGNNRTIPKSSKSDYSSSTVVAPQKAPKPHTTRTSSNVERKPLPGDGRVLSRSELRYCLFQGERIKFIRDKITTSNEVFFFNQLINEMNACCSRFKYRETDMSAVKSELSRERTRLKKEAFEMLASWRIEDSRVSSTEIRLLNPQRRNDARQIQKKLKEMGYYTSKVDGIWGPNSKAALRTFQKNHALTNDGEWDSITQFFLFNSRD